MDKIDTASKAIVGQFTLTAQLQNGKSFTITGYLYEGEAKRSIDDRLDLLGSVIDRQRTISEIPELEAQVEKQYLQIESIREVMVQMEETVKDGGKLTAPQKQQLTNLQGNLKMHHDNIKRGEQAIAVAKEKVK